GQGDGGQVRASETREAVTRFGDPPCGCGRTWREGDERRDRGGEGETHLLVRHQGARKVGNHRDSYRPGDRGGRRPRGRIRFGETRALEAKAKAGLKSGTGRLFLPLRLRRSRTTQRAVVGSRRAVHVIRRLLELPRLEVEAERPELEVRRHLQQHVICV